MTRPVLIRLVDVTVSEPLYVKEYDADAFGGRGHVGFTTDPTQALRFPSMTEAIECWRQPSTVQPLRDDGKPNRPMTAYTVTFDPAE